MITAASLFAIDVYQKKISPKKGFNCAHRVLDGTAIGCSGYAKQRIKDVGFIAGIPDIRARFKACREASEELQRRREDRKNRRKDDAAHTACAVGEGACDACDVCGSVGKSRGGGRGDSCDGCDCTPDCACG